MGNNLCCIRSDNNINESTVSKRSLKSTHNTSVSILNSSMLSKKIQSDYLESARKLFLKQYIDADIETNSDFDENELEAISEQSSSDSDFNNLF